MNEKLRAFLLLPPAFALVGALLVAPHLVHALDHGSTPATVAEIATGKIASRNVTVSAMVIADRGLREVVTKQKSQTSPRVSFYMPISDRGGEQGPTLVVMYSSRDEVFEASAHPEIPLQLEGTVRDVLWEGLSSDVKHDLEALHPLSPQVKLLEMRGISNADDKLWSVGAPLLGLILGLMAASHFKTSGKQEPA